MHITFILDDRVCAFNARVGTSIKNLAVKGRVILIQSFRTKDWDISRLPESSQLLDVEYTCSTGQFFHGKDQMLTPHSL